MKKYVYIICESVSCDTGKPLALAEGGIPSFRHAFIEAENDDEAYSVGHKTVKQPTGNGLNDYVIELPA